MAQIVFNYENLKPILNDLVSVVSNLNSISTSVKNIDIPYFGSAYFLRGLSSSLSNEISSINSIIEQVKRLNFQFEQCLSENEEDAKKLPNYKMKKRESVIR